jgi:hypothetical protein
VNQKPVASEPCPAADSPDHSMPSRRRPISSTTRPERFQPPPMRRAINVREPMVLLRTGSGRPEPFSSPFRLAILGSSAEKLEAGIQILRFCQWKLSCVASAMLPSHSTTSACNIHETIRWASFISMCGRFAATTGCSSRDHMPASCRLNASPTNHGSSPSTPPSPRFRDARVTCSGKQEASDSSPVFGCLLSVCL